MFSDSSVQMSAVYLDYVELECHVSYRPTCSSIALAVQDPEFIQAGEKGRFLCSVTALEILSLFQLEKKVDFHAVLLR